MKSKIEKKNEFPCLMEYEDKDANFVVLFTSIGCGTVVFEKKGFHGMGNYSDCWDMECFRIFNGKITLEN